jgi:hypothetical protein
VRLRSFAASAAGVIEPLTVVVQKLALSEQQSKGECLLMAPIPSAEVATGTQRLGEPVGR